MQRARSFHIGRIRHDRQTPAPYLDAPFHRFAGGAVQISPIFALDRLGEPAQGVGRE
jgi:hypothetical protein